VRSAFRKMLSKKQNNKKILNSFISLISWQVRIYTL
jgi:hypothetical protein